jgi:hypothetical protein
LNVLLQGQGGRFAAGRLHQETFVPETLTLEQLEEFDRRGLLLLPGFYPQADIDLNTPGSPACSPRPHHLM